MAFTKIAIDTFWIKNQDSLFLIKRSTAFLRDWDFVVRVCDPVDIKKFDFEGIRIWIEIPQPHRNIYLDLGGSHFWYKGKAYTMSDASVTVLNRYFPNSPRRILKPSMRVARGKPSRYRKQNYLPEKAE